MRIDELLNIESISVDAGEVQPNSHLRGHPIYFDGRRYRFCDNDIPTVGTWQARPCGHCGLRNTLEGHDGCIGELPGVRNACCGHGESDKAYIQYTDGTAVQGEEAVKRMAPYRERG